MIKIGFIADDGSSLALLERALASGVGVTVASLDADEEGVAREARQLGAGSRMAVAMPASCAAQSDVIFLACAHGRVGELPAGSLAGRIVVDVTHGAPQVGAFVANAAQNAAFALQEQTGSHLVWAQGLLGAQGEAPVCVRSDWALAKAVVLALLQDMGVDAADAGELTEPAEADGLARATAGLDA